MITNVIQHDGNIIMNYSKENLYCLKYKNIFLIKKSFDVIRIYIYKLNKIFNINNKNI